MRLITKIFIGIDILIVLCFLMVYGPIDKARVFWITTAMETGSHRYFAYIFYSEDTVKNVMQNNYLVETGTETDVNSVTIGKIEKKTSYESVYEKEVLEHEEGDIYKLITFKYGDFDCYLVAIYDPTRVDAVLSKEIGKRQTLTDIAKDKGAIVAINGGGYSWSTLKPTGLVVSNGELVYASGNGPFASAGLTFDGVLYAGELSKDNLKEKNIKSALSFGPALIVNGEAAKIVGNGGSGQNPRTVIAQRQDGIILFLVVDGYPQGLTWKGRGGVYYKDLITILQRYKAYNAINMDGGSSVTLVVEGKLINSPCEPLKDGQDLIATAWILK